MTKEEKIKEDWGKCYDELKNNIDNDGWIDSAFTSDLEIDLDVKDGFDRYGTASSFIRPKSLQGIENNNGWIKIESEADLPKDNGLIDYHVFKLTNQYKHIRATYKNIEVSKLWEQDEITHYQPIEKPKPPIY